MDVSRAPFIYHAAGWTGKTPAPLLSYYAVAETDTKFCELLRGGDWSVCSLTCQFAKYTERGKFAASVGHPHPKAAKVFIESFHLDPLTLRGAESG